MQAGQRARPTLIQTYREHTHAQIIAVLEKGYPAKEGVTDRDFRVHLPALLPYMTDYSRPYFFGWPVTRAWLALFEKCASPYAASVAPGCIGSAIPLLKELSGAARSGADFDLAEETAVHRDAPVQPEDDDEEWPPAEFRFCMVSIRNTAFACDQIFARPTRAQYAWLNAIMPLAPQCGEGQLRWAIFRRAYMLIEHQPRATTETGRQIM